MSNKNKKALVTIALGNSYYQKWKTCCKPNWEAYANKYDLDIICFTEPLDKSERAAGRNPSWQKCLTLSNRKVAGFDQVLWIDSDIVINNDLAPNIFDDVPIDHVGGCETFDLPDELTFTRFQEKMYENAKKSGKDILPERNSVEYYSNYGLTDPPKELIQCGLLVLSPEYHQETLLKVYNEYEQTHPNRYEMRPLAYHIAKEEKIHWLNSHFNTLWLVYKSLYFEEVIGYASRSNRLIQVLRKIGLIPRIESEELMKRAVKNLYRNTYFLHFAGSVKDMKYIDDQSL